MTCAVFRADVLDAIGHKRSVLATLLPHMLCVPSAQVVTLGKDGNVVRLRLVSEDTRAAELEAVEFMVDSSKVEIVRASFMGTDVPDIRYARWERVGRISAAVFDGADDTAHRVEVFEKEPFDRWIMGR